MNEAYEKELADLKSKMIQAEAFAKTIPCLAKTILDYKATGKEDHLKLGDRYKNIPLTWGISRSYYSNTSSRYLLNYKSDEPYDLPLFCIYINCYSLFDQQVDNFGLADVIDSLDLFFWDNLNSTAYAVDSQIEALLNALDGWYVPARKANIVLERELEVRNLEKKLAAAKGGA